MAQRPYEPRLVVGMTSPKEISLEERTRIRDLVDLLGDRGDPEDHRRELREACRNYRSMVELRSHEESRKDVLAQLSAVADAAGKLRAALVGLGTEARARMGDVAGPSVGIFNPSEISSIALRVHHWAHHASEDLKQEGVTGCAQLRIDDAAGRRVLLRLSPELAVRIGSHLAALGAAVLEPEDPEDAA